MIGAMESAEQNEQVASLVSRAALAVERVAQQRARMEAQLAELVGALESAVRFAEFR
jgi:hypothetical protein